MSVADSTGYILHWRFAQRKRWVHSDIVRVPDLPPTGIRRLEVLGACALGLPYPLYLLSTIINDEGLLIPYLLLVVLLITILPHMATTLLIQEDLEHLGAELKRICDSGNPEDLMGLLEEVSAVKKRWATFLRLHFICEGAGLVAFTLREVELVLLHLRGLNLPAEAAAFYSSWTRTPFMMGGPMFAAFLLWQVVSIATIATLTCVRSKYAVTPFIACSCSTRGSYRSESLELLLHVSRSGQS